MTSSLTQTLGRLVADTAADAVPQAISERAKISLVHNLVVGLAGRARPVGAHRMARRLWGAPAEATMLHDGTLVTLEGAAFANAALLNARSQDDTHPASTSHPGSPTMAAALACAELRGATGAEFLSAVVLGYEVLCRVGRDFDEQITGRGFRAAAVLGGFGAAAAAGRLLRLSADEVAHALGLAANLAGGLAQVWREGSAEGPMQMGFAARNGLTAARLASCGATAARSALEGPAGFFRAFADADRPASEAMADIGTHWQLDEITVKPFPVCAILQGPVRLLLDLVAPDQPPPADITLALSPYEAGYPGIDHAGPFASATATKMSAQFSLALAAIDGRVTPAGLDRINDAGILALASRVRVQADPALAPRQCALSICLPNGQVRHARLSEPLGRPDFAEVTRFAHALAPEIGASTAAIARLVAAVHAVDRAPDLTDLITAACEARPE
jgi:2-methylcitrate dehydratase PrpD